VYDVDTVLGVSITPVAAGLVLLERRTPHGVTVDRDAIDLTGAHAALIDVMAAVLGIQGSASAKGHRLRAVGVTWSAGSEAEARELVTTLTEFGLANTLAIRPAEATSTFTDNSQGTDADTAAPPVDAGDARIAVANGEVRLARGAALALARHAAAETERNESPRGERRRPDPRRVAAAAILTGGTLAGLAAIWIGVGPRHMDTDVAPPVPQEQSTPPALRVPSSGGATVVPVTSELPLPATDSPQGATPANTPTPPASTASHQLVPVGPQPPQHRLASPSPATPPPDRQEPTADGAPSPVQEPPVTEQQAPPSPEPAPDIQGPPPEESTVH
jgi:hypothetical protein